MPGRTYTSCASEVGTDDVNSHGIKTRDVEDVPLWWSLCTLYLHACHVRVTVGDSGLCCCVCVVVDVDRFCLALSPLSSRLSALACDSA